jgi:2-dehydro-3-deoxyphosphogluconate aldolase/(4S)-4-hydroxy-2-oxoglutarate aldolase
MDKSYYLQAIAETGVIAILRATSPGKLIRASQALQEGGIVAIEVTMTTPGALAVIAEARQTLPAEIAFGAGSVLDPESARAAILAGANFIVTPACNVKVIEMGRRYSIPVIPGAFTPTEIIAAWESGADIVKLFPASLGGPELVKTLKAPLPQVEIVPVGGIDIENTASYIRAGAMAVGVGSSLINDQLLDQEKFAEITLRAQQFIQQVQIGRAKSR